VLAQASASVETGVGLDLIVLAGSSKVSAALTGQWTGGKNDRELWSSAQDYSKKSQFQEALSEARTSAHDLRHTDLHDTGKRYVESLSASSEKAHHLREEASASLQRSQSFSKMASFTKQNAGSINENLNQEYVNWLQNQALPNSGGPMGITEAETVLSSRPDLNHAYQQRFLEDKMTALSSSFDGHGLPRSERQGVQMFENAHPSASSVGLETSKENLSAVAWTACGSIFWVQNRTPN